MKNKIYINVTVMGSVNSVLDNLLTRIKNSNLYENVDQIFLVINGDINDIEIDMSDSKYTILNEYKDISNYEGPTLDLLWNHAIKSEEDFNILYLHTKGVSKSTKNIEDWTNYLSYFNINKWEDRIKDLLNNDTSGVNLGGNPNDLYSHPSWWGYGKAPLHYSGNFWWSKYSHIKKLPNPFSWCPDSNHARWRMMDEMWLCQIPDGKYSCAWQSNIDHYQNLYPKELYETN